MKIGDTDRFALGRFEATCAAALDEINAQADLALFESAESEALNMARAAHLNYREFKALAIIYNLALVLEGSGVRVKRCGPPVVYGYGIEVYAKWEGRAAPLNYYFGTTQDGHICASSYNARSNKFEQGFYATKTELLDAFAPHLCPVPQGEG